MIYHTICTTPNETHHNRPEPLNDKYKYRKYEYVLQQLINVKTLHL